MSKALNKLIVAQAYPQKKDRYIVFWAAEKSDGCVYYRHNMTDDELLAFAIGRVSTGWRIIVFDPETGLFASLFPMDIVKTMASEQTELVQVLINKLQDYQDEEEFREIERSM